MKMMKILCLLLLATFFGGCASAKFELRSENTAYLEFRRSFPVSEKETCQALNMIHDFVHLGCMKSI